MNLIYSFERFHPFVTFLYYVSSITIFMLCIHPIFLIGGIVLIVCLNWIQDQFRALKNWWFFIVSTGLIIFIMNPLFNERGLHILFTIFDHRVTLEAVIYGAMNALSILGVTMIFVHYNEVMTPNKLLFLFSKTLPKFAVLLMLTLRFIPLMRRRLEEISSIQRSKGLSVGDGTWREKATNGLLYVQVLMTYSLEEAIQTADSMKARGYGKETRSTYNHFLFKRMDFIAAVILVILLFTVGYGRYRGYGQLTIYPVMEKFLISTEEVFFLVMYLIALSFPILIKIGGFLWWRISK
jgi:energy-coupling factor transport system permease protein